MKKSKVLKSVLVVLLAVSVGCVASEEATSGKEIPVTLKISSSEFNKSYSLSVQKGTSVFELTNKTLNITYKTNPKYGAFITGINGLKQSEEKGMHWQFYVNDELAPVGAGSYKISNNTTVEWKYENPTKYTLK